MPRRLDEYIVGIHAVESALRHNPENVLTIWVQKNRNDKRINTLLQLADKAGIKIEPISNEKLTQKSQGVRHQGVLARIRKQAQKTIQLEDILQRDSLLLLVLDGVQDVHNIGACLRTADAVGVDAIIVSKNRSPGMTVAIRKIACGAAETIPYIMVSNLARTLDMLADNDVHIIGTSGDASMSLYQCHVNHKLALVMGSEEKGMRRLTREHCSEIVNIPMHGTVESLNISVATGVCLFELKRRLLVDV